MGRKRAVPVTFKAAGYSDAKDAESVFPGAMSLLQNLIPFPGDTGVWVPRPAATSLIASSTASQWGSFNWGNANWGGGWGGIVGAAQINGFICVGNIAYGMIASTSGVYAGKDVPFSYNILTGSFNTLNIPGGVSSLPATPVSSGDWTPPAFAAFPGKVVVTHPGFPGGAPGPYIGWIDTSGFSDNTHTGNTHTSVSIDNLSTNVLQAGWSVGMTITGSGIPLNTTIVSIAANGLSIVISNPTTTSLVGTALTVAGGTINTPLWCSGNTNGNPLLAVPTDIFNFNGRAYYAVPGNGVQFSDSGLPTQITNPNQGLKPNNGLDITCFGGVPLNQTTGGILQALIGFQGDQGCQQITGDPALNNLTMNAVGQGVGCLAPNTIGNCPLGLIFISTDGLRYIDFAGNMQGPIGGNGQGVNIPIVNAIAPSRMCADYNEDVYRFSLQNGAKANQPFEEYWFHISLGIFSGPHTFPADQIHAYQAPTGASSGHGFILAAHGVLANLWNSTVIPSLTSTYVENGNSLSCVWKTVLSADNNMMTENQIQDGTLSCILPPNGALSVVCNNELGTELGRVQLTGPSSGSNWGSIIWGQAKWGGQASAFYQRDLPWAAPMVFKQQQMTITAFAAQNLAIGALRYNQEVLGYRLQTAGAYV